MATKAKSLKPADRAARRTASQARRIRSSAAWQRAAAYVKATRQLCEDCLEHQRVTLGEEVHHVLALEVRPDLAFDPDNLRLLCVSCHQARHGRGPAGHILEK